MSFGLKLSLAKVRIPWRPWLCFINAQDPHINESGEGGEALKVTVSYHQEFPRSMKKGAEERMAAADWIG
jgi:hypothetical protein